MLHVGIIPDGNRRLARRLMEKPWKGHEWGVEKIKNLLEWCKETDVKILTIYLLSLENLKKRPKEEIDFLFALARREFRNIIENRSHVVHENRVRVRFFGMLSLLPTDLQELMREIESLTKDYDQYFLNLAIAYGGRQEILEASRKLAEDIARGKVKPDEIDEKLFRTYLWTNGFQDPDLIIRTGGEKRISNFLTFQSSYSEFVFLDVMWPEIEKHHFLQAIQEFRERERRFGR